MVVSLKEKPLLIRDEIHGDMTFDPLLQHVIDHECFQRLRRIKQLGLAEFVFPCATHTRFQHSLGASYLAGQYFDSLVKTWSQSPYTYDGSCGKTRFYSAQTFKAVQTIVEDETSFDFWRKVTSLAGLLHDVGHGPLSHTFEVLNLRQDFTVPIAKMAGATRNYFNSLENPSPRFRHEDLSVLYTFHILEDLQARGIISNARHFFLPVALLLNRKMATGKFKLELETEMAQSLEKIGINGGVAFHRLLRPIISGPFDVDRMDYIQRDGRNCGVHIAGIEWRRIVSKLIPCLAEHPNEGEEPNDVVLLSNIKNQHIIDDFIFTLFQMYAQVYLHPKIVGLEDIIRTLIQKRISPKSSTTITFDLHQSLSDEKFRDLLETEFKVKEIHELLTRHPRARFEVARYPSYASTEKDLKKDGFHRIDYLERPMMKDGVAVFLYSSYKDGDPDDYFVKAWREVSPIAQQFSSIHYVPNIWVRSPY